jgi:hypothetical protein
MLSEFYTGTAHNTIARLTDCDTLYLSLSLSLC